MRLYTLMEETAVSPQFASEHGLSFYVDTGTDKLLFDFGQTEAFCGNAQKLGIDLSQVDRAFLSHGHYDHGGGLEAFLHQNNHAPVYVHPRAVEPHFSRKPEGIREIGLDISLKQYPQLVKTADVYEVSPNLLLFADVTGTACRSAGASNLLERVNGQYVPDTFAHEQSLLIDAQGKLLLFAGCAHRGMVNLVQCAAQHAGRMPDIVVGGMHLYSPSQKRSEPDELIQAVGMRLRATGARYLTGHCTGQHAYEVLRAIMGEQIAYVSAGSVTEL